jgi:Mg-chelatase subunit ChlD
MKKLMISNKISRNEEFFFKNGVSNVGGKARILCFIDATGSMGGTINQVKGKVMDMIDSLASKYPGQF